MAHAQKPDSVFRRNGRVHLNRRGHQFSQLLAAEVCASAVVMLDTPRSEVEWEYWLPTPFSSFPFTSPPVRHRVQSGFKALYESLRGFYSSSACHIQGIPYHHHKQILGLRMEKTASDMQVSYKDMEPLVLNNWQGVVLQVQYDNNSSPSTVIMLWNATQDRQCMYV
jgi:hypothetical protein